MERIWRGVSLLLGGLVGAGCPGGTKYGTGGWDSFDTWDHHEYGIDGTVIQAGSGDPIEGIEVSFEDESTTTGSDGSYVLYADSDTDCTSGCQVTATDTDGKDNGGQFGDGSAEFSSDSADYGYHDITGLDIELEPAKR